jgi:hypothetical protein
MKQQHHPHDIRVYSKGANRDVDDELIGLNQGQYIDACNMRTNPMDGDNSSIKKINGEEVLYPNVDNRCTVGLGGPLPGSYICIGVSELNDNIFEVWADEDGNEPSLIRVNGKIVLMSEDFPATAEFPFQIAKNESCIGGEVYLTDFNTPPMIFNIKDLLLNSGVDFGGEEGECTQKYFDDYNHDEQILIVKRSVDHPAFIKLDNAGSGYDNIFGSNGLPVGYVAYSFRYVSDAGDRTAWSASTPQIPVVKSVSSGCPNFPWVKTISKDPDVSVPSVYGAHVRIRIDNTLGYDFIEVRRDSWTSGDPLGTPPVSEIAGVVDILDNQFGILDILDKGGSEEVLGVDDLTEVMAAIERAKAIRYFNQRLYLMNVEYGSRVIDDKVELIGEDTETPAFPTIQNMGHAGHSDPYAATYYKSSMRGEKKGYGIILWDDQGQNTFAKKIIGAENFQMPNRREIVDPLTEGTSYFGTVKAATVDGTVDQTHEVFDLINATERTDICKFHNIAEDGALFNASKSQAEVNGDENATCPPANGTGFIIIPPGIPIPTVTGNDIGYAPFTPVSQDDPDCSSHNYIINTRVRERAVDNWEQYRPTGFSPNYYSAGVAFKGIDTTSLPEWASAFSIVETPSAGKVVAQGLGYYSMFSAEGSIGGNTTKELNEFAIYFPDFDESTGIDPSIIEAIKVDPSAFAIQLVSPMGFFTEVFSFNNFEGLNGSDSGADMITYCRILEDNGEINPLENPAMGIPDGSGDRYVAFGKWRSSSNFSPSFPSGGNGNKVFTIDSVLDYTSSSGRQKYLRISTTENFYGTGNAEGQFKGDRPKVRNWHEPVYAVNIIRREADIADSNITNYNYTGHYQKLTSKIGVSDGTDGQIYPLVDERWEDCIPEIDGQLQNDYDGLYRFVWVKDAVGQQKRWLNVTFLTAGEITTILTALQTSGVATVTDSSGSYDVYGVYTSSEATDFTATIFNVEFSWFDIAYDREFFIPNTGFEVLVKYDNRIPVRVFGGDTWINESTWAVKDKVYNKDADPVNDTLDTGNGVGDDFRLNIAFPYNRYKINDRVYILNKSTGINRIQDNNVFQFTADIGIHPARIRQLIAMWTAETRINLSFAFNDETSFPVASSDEYFALKNYVMRPYEWRDEEFDSGGATAVYADNKIFPEYEDDYGDEFRLWGLGGFRFRPQTNLDYSKRDQTKAFASVPQVGFEEQNELCTRIIWSNQRPINVQDTPTVRTFPEDNIYDLSDDTGEIKFAWDADSAKGNNLYAVTDSGVALLLVDKRIIHEINANELATVGSDVGGILNELWLEREIGMTDEMWRSFGEYSNRLYWTNYNSAFMLDKNQVVDIGRLGYHSKIYPEFLTPFGRGYEDHVTGVYDVLHDEYWVTFRKPPVVLEEHDFINRLYLVSDFYGDQDYANPFYGVADGETVIFSIQDDVETQTGIILGGASGNMLIQDACIRVAEDSPHPIKVSQVVDGDLTLLVTIPQGTCYCFTPKFRLVSSGDSREDQGDQPPAEAFDGYTFELCPPDRYNCPTLVWGHNQFAPAQSAWQGGFDYDFDRYLSFDNKSFGMRDLETYELDKGRIINGELIEAFVVQASVEQIYKDKEFIRIRVNSDNKPTRAEFFNNLPQLLNNDVQAVLDTATNPLAFKDYYGFEQYIPRKTSIPRDRMQGRLLIFKIIHNLDEDFRISSTDVQFKPLK